MLDLEGFLQGSQRVLWYEGFPDMCRGAVLLFSKINSKPST